MLQIFVIILTVLLVFVCLLMSLVVLMQRPKQEGLGAAFGGALTDRVLGSGTTDFLQKATVYLGVMFFGLTLGIATLTAQIQNVDRQAQVPEADTPATPAADDGMAGEFPDIGADEGLVPESPIENIPIIPGSETETEEGAGADQPAAGESQPAPEEEVSVPPTVEDERQAAEDVEATAEETPAGAPPEIEEESVPSPAEDDSAPSEPESSGGNS